MNLTKQPRKFTLRNSCEINNLQAINSIFKTRKKIIRFYAGITLGVLVADTRQGINVKTMAH